jgi:hypothetical protein
VTIGAEEAHRLIARDESVALEVALDFVSNALTKESERENSGIRLARLGKKAHTGFEPVPPP